MTRNTVRKSFDAHGRNLLAAALAVALWSPLVASAQEQPTTTEELAQEDKDSGDARTLDTVQVTGSRIKRSEVEGPAPVTVITGEQMKKEGFATVYDALQTLTEAIGNVQGDSDWGQSSVNAYPLNLRNLGPGRSLLLINGQRVADYPMPYQGRSNFANYNNIPTGIVERIEVLAGSASAIYGSDAMAGVVNVVLKERYDGHQVRAKYGESTRGGRENKDFSFSGGQTGDRWSLVYNLQYFDRGVLLAKDRPFMDEEADKHPVTWSPLENHYNIGRAAPYPGLRLRQPGLVDNLPGIGGVTRAVTPPAGACDQYGDLYYPFTYRGYDRNTGAETTGGTICAQRVFRNWALRTGSKDTSGYLRGTFDFNDNLQGWAAVGVWKSTGDFNSFLDGFGSPNYWDPRATNLATGAAGGAPRNFLKFIAPEEMGGKDAMLTKSKELATDFSAGLKGTMGDRFDWEAVIGRADYEVKEGFPTLNQGDMFDFFMGAQQGTAANGMPIYTPDYNKLWNPLSTSDVAAFSARGQKKATSYLTQAQFTVTGDLFEGWAGPIGFAGVVEAARQGYDLTPDPKTLNQDEDGWYTPFGNIEQGGGDRNRYAAGAEFRVPLLEKLTANVAGRYDKYDAVRDGAKSTYQAGIEWRPFDNLLIRGSYGTSFRAPDMHYVYALASSGISDFTDYVACARGGRVAGGCPRDTYKIEDAIVERGGTPDLKYEEGESYTAGFVWDAFDNFSLAVDYWKISIDNIIADIDADSLLLTEAYCTQNGFTPDGGAVAVPPSAEWCAEAIRRIDRRGPANVAGNVTIGVNPINRAETKVTGVDMSARYAIPDTRLGNWNLGLNYTNMLKFEERGLSTEPLVDTRKRQNPRTKITASVNWNWEQWNATLMMYQKSGGRDNRWGGCDPLSDGYTTMTPIDDETCIDQQPGSITLGETSKRHYERREPRRYFNGSVGYQFSDAWKVNFYVSNIFDKIYGDKWCGDFTFCVDDPVGREVSGEVVFKF